MTNASRLLQQLQKDIDHRLSQEALLQTHSDGPDDHENSLQKSIRERIANREAQKKAIEDHFSSERHRIESYFSEQISTLESHHSATLRRISQEANQSLNQVEQQRNESEWVVQSVMDDASDDSPRRLFERFKTQIQKATEEQTAEITDLQHSLELNGFVLPEENQLQLASKPANREEAQTQFFETLSSARQLIKDKEALLLPRLFRNKLFIPFIIIIAGIIGFLLYATVDPRLLNLGGDASKMLWIAIAATAGTLISLILTLILYSLSASRLSDFQSRLEEAYSDANALHHYWLKLSQKQLEQEHARYQSQQKRVLTEKQEALKRYQSAHAQRIQEIEQSQESQLQAENNQYHETRQALTQQQTEHLQYIQQEYTRQIEEFSRTLDSELNRLEEELENYRSERRQQQNQLWASLKGDWENSWKEFDNRLKNLQIEQQSQSPLWSQLAEKGWSAPREIPSQISIGKIPVNLNDWEGAVSDDQRLAPRITQLEIPFTIGFPDQLSTLFIAPHATARQKAIQAVQSVLLRLLTSVPPGKLRLTIVDPVGLGESFGGFMHLADFDEMLVTNRIWTETTHIESRLADLTEHMENVFQKYLRNEFETIEQYNESAGEVAEPYHILIINDFPAKFSELAWKRLTSVLQSGPRCGIYTLIVLDRSKPLPAYISLPDLQRMMNRFEWRDDAYRTSAEELARWPIEIDSPPPSDQFTSIVRMVGEASKDSRRVEVSFSRITPNRDEIWSRDSRSEIEIPLGRAGATKLQTMRLGKGTSQHMLVAGKTGSGKSTFLHILITNLALYYSPDEINFYLIDFKKGVEFKDYVTHALPHASVIAVESDREFGVSALQKLDTVLQERGELFRKQGVQDIAGYRNETSKPLPRILLIVDEFQEFFIEDDALSQTASLLLDRLVRQGRAFGIHVVLGSQTLGGAYSLARSTLGQVAVRVALQCSEADAHLILSENNSAARLLTRPGEAIYNDANGMIEGNHPFQIAWISDEDKEHAFNLLKHRMNQLPTRWPDPVVFEGNIPSRLDRNSALSELIQQFPNREAALLSPTIWLGDAVEINPPTALTFRHQSGHHLLMVGPDSDAALGLMTSFAITLAASSTAEQESPMVWILDGSHDDSPESQIWQEVVKQIPGNASSATPRDTVNVLKSLTAELERREAEPEKRFPPMFLLVFHLARFRDLRKGEDDFGLGSFGSSQVEKPVEPGKLFADLIAKGSAVGLHTIIWCDSMSNLERWLSRQSLKEIEQRIAFQMNASDSTQLIDSPAASRLGPFRALLYREETGTIEKFRPYGFPPADWLHKLPELMQKTPEVEEEWDLEQFRII